MSHTVCYTSHLKAYYPSYNLHNFITNSSLKRAKTAVSTCFATRFCGSVKKKKTKIRSDLIKINCYTVTGHLARFIYQIGHFVYTFMTEARLLLYTKHRRRSAEKIFRWWIILILLVILMWCGSCLHAQIMSVQQWSCGGPFQGDRGKLIHCVKPQVKILEW